MNKQEIQEALVREAALILGREPETIDAEMPIQELGIDSMSFVEILVFIEKTFQLKLIQSGLKKEDFHTLHALAGRIAHELAG